MAVAIVVLLIALLVGYGLIAVATVRTPGNWKVSLLVLAMATVPFLAAGASEIAVALTLEIVLVSIIARMLVGLRSGNSTANDRSAVFPKGNARFSLADGAGIIGGLVAVAISVWCANDMNAAQWKLIAAMGMCSGLCVAAVYGCCQLKLASISKLVIAAAIGGLCSLPVVGYEGKYLFSAGSEWPFSGLAQLSLPSAVWYVVFPCLGLAMFVWLQWNPLVIGRQWRSNSSGRMLLVFPALIGTVVTVGFAACWLAGAWILWQLARPIPVPVSVLPDPNGFDQLVGVARQLESATSTELLFDLDWSNPREPEFAAAVTEIDDQLDSVLDVLELPSQVPVGYEMSDVDIDRSMQLANLGNALTARGKLAFLRNRPDEACKYYLACVRLGLAIRRGGLLIDGLIGIARTSQGLEFIFRDRHEFSPHTCRETANTLMALTKKAGDPRSFQLRDEVWAARTSGWQVRLFLVLHRDFCLPDDFSRQIPFAKSAKDVPQRFRLEQAIMKLLATELAIKAYRDEQGTWPEQLGNLVPEYLPELPEDPFDPNRAGIRWIRRDAGIKAYSVGPDGIDNRGNTDGTHSFEAPPPGAT